MPRCYGHTLLSDGSEIDLGRRGDACLSLGRRAPRLEIGGFGQYSDLDRLASSRKVRMSLFSQKSSRLALRETSRPGR